MKPRIAECSMLWLILLAVAALYGVQGQAPNKETPVRCYSGDQCPPNAVINSNFMLTLRQCCFERAGLTFEVDGIKRCFECVVYGWNITQIIGRERDQPQYYVQFVVRKGLFTIVNARLQYSVRIGPGGNATEGEDFAVSSTPTYRFVSLDPFPPLAITLFLDGIEREGNEIFFLDLVNTGGSESEIDIFFFDSRLDVIIIDGDTVSVNITIEEANISVAENETREVCVVAIQKDFTRTIPVQIMYTDGTAIENIDFLADVSDIVISPEQNFRGCFNLNIIDNDEFEPDKDFFLTINTTDAKSTINNPSARITIEDEDDLVIGWEQDVYNVPESQTEVEVCVGIDGIPSVTLPAISITTRDGTATQNMDYVAIDQPINVTFTEGNKDAMCITIQLIADSAFEALAPEFFLVELTFPGQDRVAIRPRSTRVNIIDDEILSIGFTQTSITVFEEAGSFTACISKDQITVDAFSVSIVSLAGSAKNDTDFEPSNIQSVLTLPPQEMQACFTADDAIIDDGLVLEPTVSFTLAISGVEPFDASRVTVDQDVLEVFIVDNDDLFLGFVEPVLEVTEDVGMVEACIAASTGEFFSDVEITLIYQNGTAREGSDYEPSVSTVVFVNPDTELCFNISIADDNIHEIAEDFTISLSLPDARIMFSLSPNLTVTIQDDDSVVIGWEEDSRTFLVTEGEESEVVLCAAVMEGSISVATVVLNVTLAPFGRADRGIDFSEQAVPRQLEFKVDGPTRLCSTVEIIDDEEIESFEDENFFVELMFPRGPRPERIFIMPDQARVFITDNEVVNIGFMSATLTVDEDSAEFTVCLVKNQTVEPIEVALSVEDGSAKNQTEFLGQEILSTVLLLAEDTTSCFTFPAILDDKIALEADKSFFLDVALAGAPERIVLGIQKLEVIIVDDDNMTAGFIDDVVEVKESETPLQLCVNISTVDFEGNIELSLIYESVSAQEGSDFRVSDTSLLFTSANQQQCFSVVIVDDAAYEGLNEEFKISLSSTNPRVQLSPASLLVTIQDDDDFFAGFVEEFFEVREDEGLLQVCVNATMSEEDVELALNYETFTAEEGSDFTVLSRSLLFSGGSQLECFNIEIVNDAVYEDLEESFSVDLLSTNPRVQLRRESLSVVIEDEDDIVIGFVDDIIEIGENGGLLEICVNASESDFEEENVEVALSYEAISAQEGSDYVVLNGSLLFAGGSELECFDVEIVNDAVYEDLEEVFLVNLSSTSPRVQLRLRQKVLTVIIQDEDNIAIGFVDESIAIGENGGLLEICVNASESDFEEENVEVALSYEAISAQEGSDYVVLNGSLLFAGGSQLECFDVEIVNDAVYEDLEEVFLVNLSSTSPRVQLRLRQKVLTVIIQDEDNIAIGFVDESIEIGENGGLLEICVNASESDFEEDNVEIALSYEAISAQEGSDYVVLNRSLLFAGGSELECFNVEIVNDAVYEDLEEVFLVNLSSTSPRVQLRLRQKVLTVIIQDEDNITIGFVDESIEIGEIGGPLEICVTASASDFVEDSVEVALNYEPISAQEGSDFVVLNRSILITSTTQLQCFAVDIVGDDVFEDVQEIFAIDLSTNSTRVQFTRDFLNVDIQDDDSVAVEFENGNYSTSETSGFVTVCLTRNAEVELSFGVDVVTTEQSAKDGLDYVGGNFLINFSPDSEPIQCFNITILNDDEREPNKSFLLNLDLSSTNPRVLLGTVADTTITITDPSFLTGTDVNDTVSGDPLMTVPILVSEQQLLLISAERLSLCYEVHGESGKWFSLVSDECTSVNALYAGLSDQLNVIEEIAIRAVDSQGQCVNISVSVGNGCSAVVNGEDLEGRRYTAGRVDVRSYNTNRVRVSVPNCNDLTLVMWILCEEQEFNVGEGLESVRMNSIQLMVMRGLNYGNRRAHGLLGQFWNVPVSIAPYTEKNNFGETERAFVVSITTASGDRSYVGLLYQRTWENEEGPCLYVGDSQSYSLYEIEDPNDGVIEGIYTDYIVSEGFVGDFKFGLFEENRCN